MKSIENYYERGNTSNPKQLIFLLHGLGSNGQDLISLAPYWQQYAPDALFISPDAPFHCDMVPPGYPNSYQWFSLQSRDKDNIQEGIKIAEPILKDFIEQQRKRFDLSYKNIALVGFSQGTMMSLYTAPRLDETIAGVLGYSGALFGEEAITQDPDEFQKMPIRLIHGEADDVVPVAAWHHANEILKAAGYDISGHTTPGLTHSIDEEGIAKGGEFLKACF
jgi:phospholipase/carboxylesterase